MVLPDSDRHRPPPPSGAGPSLPIRVLHLFVLWSFAVAQPLLDLLGRHPPFFVAHDASRFEVAGLALALCFALPGLLAPAGWLAFRVAPRAARGLHGLSVAVLAAAVFLQWPARLDVLPGLLWVVIALALGAVMAWAYERSAALRTYLSLLSPAPLVFAAAFLFFSPAASLVWPEPRATTAPVEIDAEIPVVLVVFDELALPTLMDSSHRIDAERYPNFAALSATSHWFRNATTTSDATIVAVPAILTGRYLGEDSGRNRPATAAGYPNNLFTLLGEAYRLNAFEPLTNLCPREHCPPTELDASMALRLRRLVTDSAMVYPHAVLPPELTASLPPITDQWGDFALFADKHRLRAMWREIDRKPRIFAAFLDAIRAGDAKSLHFLHSSLPHVPWKYLPSGSRYGPLERTRVGSEHSYLWDEDPWAVVQSFQRYLLQLAFVDRLLGDLLATLGETGLLDTALVIVTADHGLSFQPGVYRRSLSPDSLAAVASVPLFVKLPGQRQGVISDRNVELTDVLPTIAGVLGFEIPWTVDGVSVFGPRPRDRPEKRIYGPPYDASKPLLFDTAELDAGSRLVTRMHELFGPSSDPAALYRIGPYGDLVGRALAELEIAEEARAEVRLRFPGLYADVDPGGMVPARVLGEVRSPDLVTGPLHLAVAINGTVQAATRTLETGVGRAPFAAMVAEAAFSPGRNQVEVLVVSGPAGRPRLAPTRSW